MLSLVVLFGLIILGVLFLAGSILSGIQKVTGLNIFEKDESGNIPL